MPSHRPCCTQFWLRKLHSLTGFLFLGYFLCLHVRGGFPYQSTALKVFFLYGPLLFHGLYGAYICYEASWNLGRYFWVRNGMYVGQRLTGLLLIPFLLLHLGAVKTGAAYADAGWYLAAWYAGVVASVFHLANGLFGTLVDWGVTAGPHSQRVLVGASFVAFAVLAAYGLDTLAGF